MHPEIQNALRKERIRISQDTVMDVYLLSEGAGFQVLVTEWTNNAARGRAAGVEKLRQEFSDRHSADEYFNDVMEKWG